MPYPRPYQRLLPPQKPGTGNRFYRLQSGWLSRGCTRKPRRSHGCLPTANTHTNHPAKKTAGKFARGRGEQAIPEVDRSALPPAQTTSRETNLWFKSRSPRRTTRKPAPIQWLRGHGKHPYERTRIINGVARDSWPWWGHAMLETDRSLLSPPNRSKPLNVGRKKIFDFKQKDNTISSRFLCAPPHRVSDR
jgi:hypothetical protein